MDPVITAANIFRFGLFEADRVGNTLTRKGVRVKIQDQPFRVLLLLLERPGEIVSRDDLRQKLWPEGTYVDFDGSLNVILKKLRAAIDDDSDNPRFIETVPRRGYRFIAPVSATGQVSESEKEDSAARNNGSEPAAPAVDSGAVAVRPPRRVRMPYVAYLLPALCLLIAVGASVLWVKKKNKSASRASHPSPADVVVPIRKSLAVLGFQNVSGNADDAWLATAFAEMLSTELSGGDKLRLIPGEDVANLRLASPWSPTDTLDQKTTARIGATLNSDLLVLGSYTVVGNSGRGKVRLDVRLQNAPSGEILTEIAETGSTQELFRLVSEVGEKLRERLGVPRLEETDAAGMLAAMPLDPEAARFYALGIAKLRQFDPLAAKDVLEQATQADPKFSLAHAMLARAWGQLGYEQRREEEAKQALELSTDLPRAERMLVQGDYYESIGNHEQAASVYRALFELFPDNVEYGLQLAAVDTEAGHGSQALETLGRLRNLPPPASQDPRIDLAEAKIVKNRVEALGLIRNALTKASSQGKRTIYAQARRDECQTLLYSDHPQQAPASCKDAYEVFLSAGNRAGAADTVRLTADREGAMGHFSAALALYQRALSVMQGLGEHEKTGAILNNMAIVFANEGKLDRAEQLYREAKSNFEEAGNRGNALTALANIADILYLRGNLQGAAKLYEQALQVALQLDPSRPGYLLYRLADLNLAEGRVRDAQNRAEQAIAAMRQDEGGYQDLTGAMIELGEALEAEGDLADARQQFEQTVAIRQKMGEAGLVQESEVELASLDLEENHPEQAEPLLRGAIAEYEKENEDPAASSAYVLLSRALLAEGRFDEARTSVQRGTELSLTSSDPALKLPAAIQTARVEAASAASGKRGNGPSSEAMQKLRSAVAAARTLGYYNFECEARLALGELELKLNSPSGHTQLTTLASETHSRGLELLARRAEQAAAGTVNELAINQPEH